MLRDISPFRIRTHHIVRQAMIYIDANGEGITLMINQEDRLTGTVTDGDVRRAILA